MKSENVIEIKNVEDFEKLRVYNLHKDDNIKELDDKRLIAAHFEVHRAWTLFKKFGKFGDWTKKELIEYHNKVVKEMASRNMKHESPLLAEKIAIIKDTRFARCSEFEINGQIFKNPCKDEGTNAAACFVNFLKTKGVTKVKAPNIGPNAQRFLEEGNITIEHLSYAPVKSKGEQNLPKITLEDFLSKIQSFCISNPSVILTGSIVNEGYTTGDIDILIRGKEDDPTVQKTMFRIIRMFDNDTQKRLHFLFVDDLSGPFTSFVPLYKQVVEKTDLEKVEMSDFSFIPPLKAGRRSERELFKTDEIQKDIPEDKFPLIVQLKYDGLRGQIHKQNSKVTIYSDDGKNITDSLRKIAEEVKDLNEDNFILDCEIEQWKDGRHIGREVIAGRTHQKTPFDDAGTVASLFDVMVWKGKYILKEPYEQRFNHLHELNIKQSEMYFSKTPEKSLNIAPSIKVNNYSDLRKAIVKCFSQKYSEGAMIKQASSIYEKDGITMNWWKVKKYAEVHAIVTKRVETRTPNVYTYHLGLSIPTKFEKEIKEKVSINNKEYIETGKCFNSKKKLKIGDIVTVKFHTLFTYSNGTFSLKLYEPKIMEHRPLEKEPDDIYEAVLIAKKAGLLQTKERLTEEDIQSLSSAVQTLIFDKKKFTKQKAIAWAKSHNFKFSNVEETPNFWRLRQFEPDLCKRAGGLKEFDDGVRAYICVTQLSSEEEKQLYDLKVSDLSEDKKWGAYLGSHYRGKSGHLDLRLEREDDCCGWTLFAFPEGAIKEDVTTVKQAKELDKKIDIKFKPTYTETKTQCTPKAPEPKEWMGYEKAVPPGEVGATKHEWGVFTDFDHGTVEYLCSKPYFYEYYFHMKRYKGIFYFRQLENVWKEKTQPGRFVWFAWKAKTDEPYVLTRRSITSNYHTHKGQSELPRHVRKQIPEQYRYWEKPNSFEVRKALIEAIKKKEVKIRFELSEEEESTHSELTKGKYALVHHWWKGQTVVREGPTTEHYDLYIKTPDREKLLHYILVKNPLKTHVSSALIAEPVGDKYLTIGKGKPVEIAPGQPDNPTKNTPAYLEQVASGEVTIFEDKELFKKFKFEKLGTWIFVREQKTNMWTASKAENLSEEKVELSEVNAAHVLLSFGKDIALSPGVWNGFYYPPEVIHKVANLVDGCPIDVEHNGRKVGKVLSHKMSGDDLIINPLITEEKIKEDYDKGKYCWSMDFTLMVDKIRRIVKDVKKVFFASLVENPACKVCTTATKECEHV